MKKMLHKGFNPSKCKTSLKMAVSRVKLLRNKKEIQLTQLKREVAQLLQTGQDQTARIRVEHVVREEKTITAFELIDIYCELIVARLPIIEAQKNCPIDLKEAIASIIFASPRCSDIPELMDIRKHFTAKYGKEFVTSAIELRPDCGVNRTLIEKLSATAPDGPTKVKILTGIAEEHKIKWEPNWFKDNEPEPPAYVPNVPNTDKISKMHAEPQNFQASYAPKPDIPSNIHHVAEPEVHDSKFAYSAVRPSGTRTGQGTEPEIIESNQSFGSVENSSFMGRQKWNMEFKDASAAAHAAAESAELASMAARAAAELASRGKFIDDASADSNFVQNEGNRVRATRTDLGGFEEKYSTDNSLRERPSRMEHLQRDPNLNVNASGMMDENKFKHDRPESSQQSNSPMKAVQKDGNQPYTGKGTTNEVNPKTDHDQYLERYDEVQDDFEIEEQHDSSPEVSSSQVASKYEDEIFSYSNRHDGSVENPFYGEVVETRNQPTSSYQSQSSGLSEKYGIMPRSDTPKFDDDLDEDPFDSTGRGNFYKDDLESEEPYKESAFHSTISQDRKDDVLAFSEQRKSAFDSHKHLFSEGDDESMLMKKESTNNSINEAAPHFDDYVADEDDDGIQSPGRKSPEYSSPDEERLPKKYGVSSSKHLYQPELTESFKNSPIYSQLVKPISLGDDSDGSSSENDEEVKKSEIPERTFSRNVLYNPKKTDSENIKPSIIFEDSTAVHHSEEHIEEDSGASKKSGSSTRSRSDAKSYDRHSFSRLLDEAERLSTPRRSPLQATPDVIDDSQDNYQSNAESRNELNVESLFGGLKNKGYKLPPYPKGTSAYSSSSSMSTVDDAPKVHDPATLSSGEIKEPLNQKEPIRKKKTSSLQSTYFEADTMEDADWKGSIRIQNSSDKKILDYVNQGSSSRVSQSYFDSEDISSGEDSVKQTSLSNYRSGAGFSRRTRTSGAQTETRSSYKTSSISENSEKDKSSVKPKSPIQMESLEPRRRDVIKTRPSHLSKMSSGEEISAPSSVAGKQATSSKATDSPKNSSSTEKTLVRGDSDKKASHVHPKLPTDYDDFASQFLSRRRR